MSALVLSAPKGTRWAWLGVCVLGAATICLGVATFEYQQLQMDRDEARHARQGEEFAAAVARHHPGDVVDLLARSGRHPPAHGILLGSWFLLWGMSVLTARLYSVLHFLLLGIVIWKWAADRCPNSARRLALLPVLWLATDSNYITNATLGMLEVPAALWTALSLWLFARALETEGRAGERLHAVAALAAIMTFMTRYSFGIPVLGAMTLSHLRSVLIAGSDAGQRREAVRRTAVFAAPVVLLVGGWLLGLGHWKALLRYSRGQPMNVERWSLDNLLYYPRDLFLGAPSSWVLGCGFVVGLAWAIRRRRLRAPEQLLLSYLALAFLELFFVRQKAPRFGMPLAPPLWILTAWLLDQMLADYLAARRQPVPARLVYGLAVVAMLSGGLSFLRIARTFPMHYENVSAGVHRSFRDIATVVTPWERDHTRIVLFGRADQWSGPALTFHLVSTCTARGFFCDVSIIEGPRWQSGQDSNEYSEDLEVALVAGDYLVAYDATPQPEYLRDRSLLFEHDYECKLSPKGTSVRTETVHVAVLGKSSRTPWCAED